MAAQGRSAHRAAAAVTAAVQGELFELKPLVNPLQHELVTKPFGQSGGWINVGSQDGSQRAQVPGLVWRRPANVAAGQHHTGRQEAALSDPSSVYAMQEVRGSNPRSSTSKVKVINSYGHREATFACARVARGGIWQAAIDRGLPDHAVGRDQGACAGAGGGPDRLRDRPGCRRRRGCICTRPKGRVAPAPWAPQTGRASFSQAAPTRAIRDGAERVDNRVQARPRLSLQTAAPLCGADLAQLQAQVNAGNARARRRVAGPAAGLSRSGLMDQDRLAMRRE